MASSTSATARTFSMQDISIVKMRGWLVARHAGTLPIELRVAHNGDDGPEHPGLDHGGDQVPGSYGPNAGVQDDYCRDVVHNLCDHHAAPYACKKIQDSK